MTENGDGEAERIRRDCLAEAVTAHGMCDAGYVVETRPLVEPNLPSSNAHDVVYTGRCLFGSTVPPPRVECAPPSPSAINAATTAAGAQNKAPSLARVWLAPATGPSLAVPIATQIARQSHRYQRRSARRQVQLP